MSKNSERVQKWRRNLKLRMVEVFRGKCGICGYDKLANSLEFHHLDPSTKEFLLSTTVLKSWKIICEELEKCVCLCANCHREVHANVTVIPNDIQRFDESLSTYKKHEIEYDKCPICRKKKRVDRKVCSQSCAGILSSKRVRKVDWTIIDVIELVNIFPSYEAIGRQLGVTGAAVKRQYLKTVNF